MFIKQYLYWILLFLDLFPKLKCLYVCVCSKHTCVSVYAFLSKGDIFADTCEGIFCHLHFPQ